MKLIRSVEIERFRSFERQRFEGLGDVTALVGANNSGKSNVLRALNLFFNDETDPDIYLEFGVDYRLRPPSKKKKLIRVSVAFELPDEFRFRRGLEPVENLLGREFEIRKTWTLDQFDPVIEVRRPNREFESLGGEEARRAVQFLDLISYRYVPNRAIPAQVIRQQSSGLLRQLAKRLSTRGGEDVERISDAMILVAKEMVAPIAEDMTQACDGISDLELSTPATVFDMLSQTGFRAGVGPYGQVEDAALGSGVQNLLMFHVLYMIDKGLRSQGFGWTQAAVWAIEEPESALHRNLQVRLANLLRAYSRTPDSRFQIILTTHQDVFVYAATAGFLVSLDGSPASVAERLPIGDLAKEAESLEVTGLPDPVLQFPFDTVVLVEGTHDARVLSRAAALTGLSKGVKFVAPSSLDPAASDGDTGIQGFVSQHRHVLPQRLSGYPLLVLLDWEVSEGRVRAIASRYGDGGDVNVRRMDAAWADPDVGSSFRGIERFYTVGFLEAAADAGVVNLARRSGGELVVTPADLGGAKAALAERFSNLSTVEDCEHLRPVLEWVDSVRRGGLF